MVVTVVAEAGKGQLPFRPIQSLHGCFVEGLGFTGVAGCLFAMLEALVGNFWCVSKPADAQSRAGLDRKPALRF